MIQKKKNYSKQEREYIEQLCRQKNFPLNLSFSEKLFWLRNNLTDFPRCLVCQKPTRFQISKTSYSSFCSSRCAALFNQQSRQKTCQQRYGQANILQSSRVIQEKQQRQLQRFLTYHPTLQLNEPLKGFLRQTVHQWKCLICGHQFKQKIYSIKKFRGCPFCRKTNPSYLSDIERQVYDFLLNFLNKEQIFVHDRTILSNQLELDFWIPSHRIAIEIHGLFYHNEKYFHRFYHQQKHLLCEKQDIHLIQIFSDEIKFQWPIVQSKLLYLFKQKDQLQKVHARKCQIQFLDKQQAKQFLKANHLQGSMDQSTWKIGAFYKNELISVMSFSWPRRSLGRDPKRRDCLELTRFCHKNFYFSPGLFSRMWTFALTNLFKPLKICSVYSYADARWSRPHSNIYLHFFHLIRLTKPNYFYVRAGQKRLHRFYFRKQVLVQRYPHWAHLSERQIMEQLNYHRVWDAGHYLFEAKINC